MTYNIPFSMVLSPHWLREVSCLFNLWSLDIKMLADCSMLSAQLKSLVPNCDVISSTSQDSLCSWGMAEHFFPLKMCGQTHG